MKVFNSKNSIRLVFSKLLLMPAVTALLLMVGRVSWADDVDILLACSPPPIDDRYQNLLFIMDDSSSMWSELAPGYDMWDALDDAFVNIMSFLPSINAGMIIFGQGTMGGYVAYPMAALDSPPLTPVHPAGAPSTTVREELVKIIQNNDLDQGTSTHGAMEEAISYLKGEQVHYGARRLANPLAPSMLIWRPYGDYTDDPDSHRELLSHPDSYELDGGSYVSPGSCQWSKSGVCADEKIVGTARYKSPFESPSLSGDSHVQIIMMIDGGPAGPNDMGRINSMIGTSDCVWAGESFDETWGDDRCLRALADYLGSISDIRPDLPGRQTVSLTTIGFAVGSRDSDLLQEMSNLGMGSYFYATNALELRYAYEDAVGGPYEDMPTDAVTFSQSAVVVDYTTGLEHSNDVYFPILQASNDSPVCSGNLKRYDFTGKPPVLKGRNNVETFNESTGKFNDGVKSYWTTGGNDGNDASDGGAAERLPAPADRKLYTSVRRNKPMTDSRNALSKSNPWLWRWMFGDGVDNTQRDQLIDWVRGEGAQRYHLGDPLHSTPEIFVYGRRGTNEETKIAFMGTNQGYLHAFNAETGVEEWAFMPQELLPNIQKQVYASAGDDHIYGMDSTPVLWVDNKAPFDMGAALF